MSQHHTYMGLARVVSTGDLAVAGRDDTLLRDRPMELVSHPLANLFPLIEGEEFQELVVSIKENGLREPIILLEGQILDGRNRHRACLAAGIEPQFDPLPDGIDPLHFVIDRNLRRRHLTDDQRRMVAARLATMGPGRPAEETFANGEVKREHAAELLSVDVAGIDRARAVITKGAPELQDAVDARKLTVRMAADLAAQPLEVQREIVSLAHPKAIKAAVKKVREEEQAKKKERRKARERALGELQAPTGRFGVIVEDYEWDYEVWSRDSGMDRHASNNYPVSKVAHTAEEIVKRTADRLTVAADDCLLAMWTTVPHLAIGLDVLRLRGFRYVSHYIWGKDKIGTGHWNQYKHEILLLGVKGRINCPSQGDQWESLIVAPRNEHSEKPECFLKMLEDYFPTLPKLELNARRYRAGWTQWPLEAPDPAMGSPITPGNDIGPGDGVSIPFHAGVVVVEQPEKAAATWQMEEDVPAFLWRADDRGHALGLTPDGGGHE